MTNPPSTNWRKSRRSHTGDNCVEIAAIDRSVAIRDSKDPDGGRLAFPRNEWSAFADRIKAGLHDLP